MQSHRMPQSVCPVCRQQKLDAAAGGSVAPVPGDLTVCIECAAALKFGHQLELVALSAEELEALPVFERGQIAAAQRLVRQLAATERRRVLN